MAEETTQQTDEAVESQSETQTQTLEDLYKDLNVSEEAEEFVARPQQQPREPVYEPQVPDPIMDPEGYRAHQAQQATKALYGELTAVKSQLTEFQQQQYEQQTSADIGKAVDKIAKKVEDVDRDVLDAMLNAQAYKDPRFKKLWENRYKSPAAWDKALDAFSNTVADKFKVKVDPQIEENRRAVHKSQQSMASTAAKESDDPFENLDPNSAEWNAHINKIKGSQF